MDQAEQRDAAEERDHPAPQPAHVDVTLTFTMTPQNRAGYAAEYGLGGDPRRAPADFAAHLEDAIREHLVGTGDLGLGCYMIREFTEMDVTVAEPDAGPSLTDLSLARLAVADALTGSGDLEGASERLAKLLGSYLAARLPSVRPA